MGRLEWLTAVALGRGCYEEEVIQISEASSDRVQQLYNERGHPRNPETKRLEREQVRAANEVMQVTGVVEDFIAAKDKASKLMNEKNLETLTGLRLMEAGRTVFVAGVWGVLGLRRRILLYKPYSETGMLGIIRQEASIYSIPHLFLSGLPAVFTYHLVDWVSFLAETVVDSYFNADENGIVEDQIQNREIVQRILDAGFSYLTIQLRMFAILQQLHIIPSSRLLPAFQSFIPFSHHSPLQFPPNPSLGLSSLLTWGTRLLQTAMPMFIILAHGKVKWMVSQLVYRPIYKLLPRPTGDSMFSGLDISAPTLEYDTPDRTRDERINYRSEDEPTLRALEGLPALSSPETRPRQQEHGQDSSDEEEQGMTHATLISFDVEATDVVESSHGTWSAELRSANEPKPSLDVKYRVTGVTMLPTIMAAEGLREIVAGIIVMPLETFMVRVIGRAYRTSDGLGMDDMFAIGSGVPSLRNLLAVSTVQLVVSGVVWAGFTVVTQWNIARMARQRLARVAEKSKEGPPT